MQWLRESHLNALLSVIEQVKDDDHRLRSLNELALGVLAEYCANVTAAAVEACSKHPEPPLTHQDLIDVRLLVQKGVAHNGVVPELDTVRVGRALQYLAELLDRAQSHALSQEEQRGLEWVFDFAAFNSSGEERANVRLVETIVRQGLGLSYRLTDLPMYNELQS